MNRKNLTAAVLAGLAGAAGIAGTAQAVNLNPDGLGQVLLYPYYTANDGNDTLLSVVNTSSDAKAVKVRFKEGFNSREVLDFNMYMSAYDVWAAAISMVDGTPTLIVPDSTCTVPYLYEQNQVDGAGQQPFLPYDYDNDAVQYRLDGGPTGIARAAEGHFEMIEMGTLTGDSAADATHVIDADGTQHPKDCQALVDAWTGAYGNGTGGYWLDTGKPGDADYTDSPENKDIGRNSGGLFGGAAIINVSNGTMFSYDARAIQGFDKAEDGVHLHYEPGNSHPSLNDGDQNDASIFFGAPRDESVTLHYDYTRSVDALSAVLMHEHIMNEFNIEAGIHAASEWVVTFPTKNWYVDNYTYPPNGYHYEPDPTDIIACHGWQPGDDYPSWSGSGPKPTSWEACNYIKVDNPSVPVPPFTSVFDGGACEPFAMTVYDREENASSSGSDPGVPIVSPPPPGNPPPSAPNDICYEVNVLRFGNDGNFPVIFGTPEIEGQSLLKTVDTGSVSYDSGNGSKPIVHGWAIINLNPVDDNALLCETGANNQGDPANGACQKQASKSPDKRNDRWVGLKGLPVTGFWAEQFENGYLPDNPGVLANYGGLFSHKGNVHRSGVGTCGGGRQCGND